MSVNTLSLEQCVDRLAEAMVMVETSDLPALAQMHQLFQNCANAASVENAGSMAAAMNRCADLLQDVILDEVTDVKAAMGVLTKSIEITQEAVRTRTQTASLTYPTELGLSVAMPPSDIAPPTEVVPPKVTPEVIESDEDTALRQPFDPATGDADLLREFVNEAMEHLENAEVSLLALESAPDDTEAINAVFRAFHTIKGVAGMLQIVSMQRLAHESENLLDRVRKGSLAVSTSIMDVSLESVDALRGLVRGLDSALAGGLLRPEPGLPALVARVRAVADGQVVESTMMITPVEESGHLPLGELLVKRGALSHKEVAMALRDQLHACTPREIGEMLIRANVISRTRLEEALEIQMSQPDKRIGEILIEKGWATEEAVEAGLSKQQRPHAAPPLGEVLVRTGKAAARDVVEELRHQQLRASGSVARETLKVDAERLDHMVNMIGELVIAQSMVTQSESFRRAVSQDVLRHLHQLDRITRDLQETGMSLRMVPLRSTFQKIARLARDLSQKTGKPVDFLMQGEDTEVDKSMVERIGDPLVHMIRNSMDHGLEESVVERISAGKPERGTVSLRAFHRQGSLMIEIEDDGRGLDRDRILAKARERGLDRAGEMLTDAEVWQLIFEPGFSTASAVTDVSGRGVGMDVVRKNVESMRGQIIIQSEKGKGTTFSIQLPLTLAIIDGMVVEVGNERYIIPTLSVMKSIQARPAELFTLLDSQEMLSLQGDLIPIARLSRLFKVTDAVEEITKAIIVIVESSGRKLGLLVDCILGQQQIVIKSLGHMVQQVQGISGGAIMSDGNIGLILDVAGISTLVQEGGAALSATAPRAAARVGSISQGEN